MPEDTMLRTTIDTADAKTGKELPIPADLLAKVQRADAILKSLLHKVGEKFDVEARWWFEPGTGREADVLLSLSTSEKSTLYPFPKTDLRDDESMRRSLWKPLGFLVPLLKEEVDRDFARIRQALATTATAGE